ncbi:MAG: FMN-binding protein [Bacteroidales bacterium]|nr:FMN-binding protein [Bacteroidales bacterium]
MNTNSNVYTVVYTTIVVVIVAAVLAFVSQTLKPKQEENEKAETISQILTAAQFGEKEHWQEIGNAATVKFFEENIEGDAAITSTSQLKALNYKIKDGSINADELPIYAFSNGISVIPVYGAGLWGPVWGYIALSEDLQTVVGAYFDHESETPGLGGKIKDDPSFRAQFAGKKVIYGEGDPFSIVKGGAPEGTENAVDAITGATMTSKGLNAAIITWLNAYQEEIESARKAVEVLEELAEQSNAEEEPSNE